MSNSMLSAAGAALVGAAHRLLPLGMLLAMLTLAGTLVPASTAQTVQAGIAFEGTNEIVVKARTSGDLSGGQLTNAIVTICDPNNITLGINPGDPATSTTFGFVLDRVENSGGTQYFVFATPGAFSLSDLNAPNAEVELFRVAVTSGASPSNSVTLAPTGAVNNGDFYFEVFAGGVGQGRQNTGDPYFQQTTALPVELTAFTASRDGADVVLSWATASETNNAGFFVERRVEDGAQQDAPATWAQLGFVDGAGTTTEPRSYRYRVEALDPGAHVFRLKQIDYDGSFAYSLEVEVTVEMAERYVLEAAYPNPFNPSARFRFAVREAVPVRVALYDALGREVRVLFAGTPVGGQMQEVRIDGRSLTSGTYFVRLLGEGIQAVQQVTLLK